MPPMKRHPQLPPTSRPAGGVALVAVLWLVALLSVLATAVVLVSVSEGRAAQRIGEVARLEAIADSAIRVKLLQLTAPAGLVSLPASDPHSNLSVLGVEASMKVEREGGRIDLNTADENLLLALFTTNGWGESEARSLVARIADWKDPDDTPREGGAERPDYLSAGRRYGPRNGPFQAVEEIRQVLGADAISRELLDSMTVYTHLRMPSRALASEPVRRALTSLHERQLAEGTASASSGGTSDADTAPPPSSLLGEVVRIRSCVGSRDHSQSECRVAVVRLTGNVREPFQVLEWHGSSE
jgi:general secretion pathway protein K